jgi:hypothetical protein
MRYESEAEGETFIEVYGTLAHSLFRIYTHYHYILWRHPIHRTRRTA